MEKIEILNLSDSSKWYHYINRLPLEQKDIYFTPGYYQLFQNLGDGEALCFVFEQNNNIILYPFLLNSINAGGYNLDHEYFDIQGAYGYNGFCSSSKDYRFIMNFYNYFNQYCIEKNIIAEFIRFHPMLIDLSLFSNSMTIVHDRDTVMIDLQKPYDEIWANEYSSKNRNMIRKAQSLGYKIQIIENPSIQEIESFIEIYNYSMDAVKSKKYYYFNHEFFLNTFKYLKGLSFLFNVLNNEGAVTCSSVFLHYKNYFHYHLSGRSTKSDNSVNSFLIDRAVVYAQERGAKIFHLGGGRSNANDDTLLKFKKSFSKQTLPFYIGKKIYNERIYNEIVSQWERRFPEKSNKYKDFLLKYRF